MSLEGGIDAATPPSVSAQCKITYGKPIVVEWTEPRLYKPPVTYLSRAVAAPDIQTRYSTPDLISTPTPISTPALIINYDHESMLEMSSDGKFYCDNFPIDIIISVMSIRHTESQEDSQVTTITACWKI